MMRMMQIRRGETSRRTVSRSRMRTAGKANAFTLIELMVAITIMMLLAATALPTVSKLFTAGADKQAYNIISAQIAAARAVAIVEGTYAGVHVQIADRDELENICYAAVVWIDPATSAHEFTLADGGLASSNLIRAVYCSAEGWPHQEGQSVPVGEPLVIGIPIPLANE